jgi:hypothetical protein
MHGFRVQLAYPRFGHAEHFTNLAQAAFFLVVQP